MKQTNFFVFCFCLPPDYPSLDFQFSLDSGLDSSRLVASVLLLPLQFLLQPQGHLDPYNDRKIWVGGDMRSMSSPCLKTVKGEQSRLLRSFFRQVL